MIGDAYAALASAASAYIAFLVPASRTHSCEQFTYYTCNSANRPQLDVIDPLLINKTVELAGFKVIELRPSRTGGSLKDVLKRLRWWWYDFTDYRFEYWFHNRVTCRIFGHKPMHKMSGTVCERCSYFEAR